MKPKTKLKILAPLFAFALALLAGCGAGSASAPQEEEEQRQPTEEASPSHIGNFVGEVPGTDAFIAVVVDRQNRVLAYVCDGRGGSGGGEPFEWSITEWFRGSASEEGDLDLTGEGGARLLANVEPQEGRIRGTLTLPDRGEFPFEAEPAEAPAGLYRKVEEVNNEELVGGWILLENGEERGAVKNRSTGFVSNEIDLARPSQPVKGFMESGIEF